MKKNTGKNDITGVVLEIQRMSTDDGPGLRTTVFMKGCTLACSWCHNPESINLNPQTQWVGTNCIGCRLCIDVCKAGAISAANKGIIINRALCIGCGKCTKECPSTAMERLGENWLAEDLVKELVKDRAYFEKSKGGVTFSGGEATLQSEFVFQVLMGLKQQGINTALDTCGQCSVKALEKLLPCSDIILFDLKEIDMEKHKEFTGHSNQTILENLCYVAGYVESAAAPCELWIRTPIIPDTTSSEQNITGIGQFISGRLGNTVTRWELCAFNNLCKDKYLRLGLDWKHKNSELLSSDTMEHLAKIAKSSVVDPKIVHWSGSTVLTTT